MKSFGFKPKLKCIPPLDPSFIPISLANQVYKNELSTCGDVLDISIALERSKGHISAYDTQIFGESCKKNDDNKIYIERLIKTLLWIKGGWKIYIAGPDYISDYIKEKYTIGAKQEFDAIFMGKVFENEFCVINCKKEEIPKEKESAKAVGKNLDGYRIGFDAGGSDRKVSAVVDGKSIYSEEVVWYPKLSDDPQYQYDGIIDSIKRAAHKLPRVDAIGVSSAGIYIENRIMAASLFIKVPDDLFQEKVKNMFFDVQKEMSNVPIEVANDGDVTALAGSMSLEKNRVLGIAMGTSQAAGYVDAKGYITGWLNELAFVPIDYNPNAMQDEWSGDIGCGVKYFSQDGVIKLAGFAGIEMDLTASPAKNLKIVQELMKNDDQRAIQIYESIGCYLAYALAYYSNFYDMEYVLLMGRVTSGKGGNILVNKANEVLSIEFPELAKKLNVSLPDEKSRRVGQSVAAASLPKI